MIPTTSRCGRRWRSSRVPLGFHEGSGSQLRQVGEQFGANTMLKHVYSHPVEQMLAVGAFCAGGILERHPRLRVAFLEGNCSWVPFLLWRMDEHWEWLGDIFARELTMAPSAYFKRQCFVSVECDEEPVKHVIEAIGDERIVFSTDFPHGDSKFPRAVESFLQLPISEQSKRKILWDNCAAYYGLPPDREGRHGGLPLPDGLPLCPRSRLRRGANNHVLPRFRDGSEGRSGQPPESPLPRRSAPPGRASVPPDIAR